MGREEKRVNKYLTAEDPTEVYQNLIIVVLVAREKLKTHAPNLQDLIKFENKFGVHRCPSLAKNIFHCIACLSSLRPCRSCSAATTRGRWRAESLRPAGAAVRTARGVRSVKRAEREWRARTRRPATSATRESRGAGRKAREISRRAAVGSPRSSTRGGRPGRSSSESRAKYRPANCTSAR